MTNRICRHCGGPLIKQKLYCSHYCQTEGQRIVRTDRCEQCGKPLVRQQGRFCSRHCYSTYVIDKYRDEPLRAALGELWHEGISTAEIGRRLKISKNAVIGKAHRWGLPARPSPIRAALPDIPRIKTPFFVHNARATEGWEPLPPMHPISWGAIAL